MRVLQVTVGQRMQSDRGESEESDEEEKRRFRTKIETKVIKTKDGQLSVRHHRLKGKKYICAVTNVSCVATLVKSRKNTMSI